MGAVACSKPGERVGMRANTEGGKRRAEEVVVGTSAQALVKSSLAAAITSVTASESARN